MNLFIQTTGVILCCIDFNAFLQTFGQPDNNKKPKTQMIRVEVKSNVFYVNLIYLIYAREIFKLSIFINMYNLNIFFSFLSPYISSVIFSENGDTEELPMFCMWFLSLIYMKIALLLTYLYQGLHHSLAICSPRTICDQRYLLKSSFMEKVFLPKRKKTKLFHIS